MIYGNSKILQLIDEGKIGIQPFYPHNLQGVSYDMRLDKYFVKKRNEGCFNPSKDKFVARKMIQDEYLLEPRERVLASTIEKAGSKALDITTKIFSKSSWARHGLEVCSCAGYGDPLYYNHWTLEIFNKNDYPVLLQKGMIIAQISFEEVIGCEKVYLSKYNNNGENRIYTDEERFNMIIPKLINKV